MAIVVGVLILTAAVWQLWPQSADNTDANNTKKQHATTAKPQPTTPKTIRLIAMGDMLPHDSVNANAKTASGYDYQRFFQKVSPYISSADIVYCNQESPTVDGMSISGYPTFNAPPKFAQDLQAVGCNLINLANNHADDRGQAGITGTLNTWGVLTPLAAVGINRSSAEQKQVHYFTVQGVKFAYLGYAECSNNSSVTSYGLNLLSNKSLVSQQITTAKANADIVIVGAHWCRENITQPTQYEKNWAQYFADHGVDIVIGTGPHFLQPVDQLVRQGGGKTLVWYSLGNFLSTQIGIQGLIGGIASMTIDVSSKSVTKIGFMPTYMSYYWTPAQASAYDLAARKNLMIYPLDQAGSVLPNAVDKTTVAEQTTYVKHLLNQNTAVPILTSQNFNTP